MAVQLPASELRRQRDQGLMKQLPVTLTSQHRAIVESAIRETCTTRKWRLWTVNVRTNHAHSVISADKKPEAILSALKANATRTMRGAGAWTSDVSPWAHGGSKKYLWDDKELAEAITYVEGAQGEPHSINALCQYAEP